MASVFIAFGNFIRPVIDFFYPPFRRYMSLQFFRYGVTGVINLGFDWVLYFFVYNFVLFHKMVDLGFVTLSSHIAALCIKFPVVLVSGFLLQKYVTFNYSNLQSRVQLFRYLVVFAVNLALNYLGLKLLVDYFGLYPTPSNMIVSIVTIGISYFSQRYYTFKMSVEPVAKM
ncbi:MAG: GtrA family protein [Bacteroidetes bacterium]|nr:GtrA family protein [Bacteroidota bacterium]